ncbi:MAG: ABC transporter permease, partial [Paludibacteraceae bacterium]|nr:ABC transporter permease [Paludibacteraceae bacterium]
MKALLLRILKQLKNDPRTLALMLVAPFLIMSLIYLLLGDSDYRPVVATYDMPSSFTETLTTSAEVKTLPDSALADTWLESDSADAVVWAEGHTLCIRVLESNSKSGAAIEAVQERFSNMLPAGRVSIQTIYGNQDDTYFASMAYVFLAVLAFFFTFIVSGMALVRERFTNTLERLLMTPIRRWQVVGGYVCGYGVVAMVQVVLIMLFTVYVLQVPVAGSIGLCLLVMLLLGICAVELGALVSIFANGEFQVAQFIPVIIIPQIFFTGIIPLDMIPYGLGNICYLMPMYYGAAPLKHIMQQGAGFMDILPWLGGLLLFIVLLFVINTL